MLRFYWFRLADVAVPLGVALWASAGSSDQSAPAAASGRVSWDACCWLAVVVAMAAISHGRLRGHAVVFPAAARRPAWGPRRLGVGCRWLAHPGQTPIFPRQPRADRLADYAAWREACDWASQPEHISPEATFLTPRMSQTFKWYAGRGEAGTWKELPQDAQGIVEWWRRMQAFYGTAQPAAAGPLVRFAGRVGRGAVAATGRRVPFRLRFDHRQQSAPAAADCVQQPGVCHLPSEEREGLGIADCD